MLLGMCCKCQGGDAGYSTSGSGGGSILSGCDCSLIPASWRVTSGAWSLFSNNCTGCANIQDVTTILTTSSGSSCGWVKLYTACMKVTVSINTTNVEATFEFFRLNGSGSVVQLFRASRASLGISSGSECIGPYNLPFLFTSTNTGSGTVACSSFGTTSNTTVTITAA